MKFGYSKLALMAAVAATAAPAFAQEPASQFERNRYVAVQDRPQAEFDPEAVILGAFTMNSSVDGSVSLNDNIFARPNADSDTIVRVVPTANFRSNWLVHELNFGATVDHREYLDNGDESATDWNLYGGGRVDVTRDFSLGGRLEAARIVEPRYEPASQNQAVRGEYDRRTAEAQANYMRDRIQLNGQFGVQEVEFDNVAQAFRDNTETYFGGRASYAISPAVALFVQGRSAEIDYDQAGTLLEPSRDADRTTIAGGFNFELAAPFRGDVAIGYIEEDKKDPTLQDTDGLSVDARLQWFPTDLTTVTFTGYRTVYDPGLRAVSSAFLSLYGARVDHELRRNLILFGSLQAGDRDYGDVDAKDDLFNADVGLAWKLNKNARLEAGYAFRKQDASGTAPVGADFDQNVLSVGIKLYP